MSCVFCRIVSGEASARFVHHWPETVAFYPLNPVVPGHILFVPRTHVEAAHVDPMVTAKVVQRAAEYASAAQAVAINHGDGASAYNLITSYGKAATQSIKHLHVHYVPRSTGDDLPLPWTNQFNKTEAAS